MLDPDRIVPPSVPKEDRLRVASDATSRIGFWEATFAEDSSVRYSLEVSEYLQDLSQKLSQIEDDAAEARIVEWLRARGWTVVRDS